MFSGMVVSLVVFTDCAMLPLALKRLYLFMAVVLDADLSWQVVASEPIINQ